VTDQDPKLAGKLIHPLSKLKIHSKSELKSPHPPAESRTTILSIPVEAFAMKVSIIDFTLLAAIKKEEWANWLDDPVGKVHLAPNVRKMVERIQYFKKWVGTIILTAPDSKQIANTISKFIEIAKVSHIRHISPNDLSSGSKRPQ
jgi:hypothetical protein